MNITVDRAVIEQALEALEWEFGLNPVGKKTHEIITALRTALEQQYMTNAAGELEPVTIVQTGVGIGKPEQEPVKLRRGDILRCIETDELCTVWATSTTGKTLVKWGANNFGEYTAEQIGELFWLEPEPSDLELAAERSDNYAAFHSGYRFAVAHSSTQPEPEPISSEMLKIRSAYQKGFEHGSEHLPQRKPLTEKEILTYRYMIDWTAEWSYINFARAIEAAHNIKE